MGRKTHTTLITKASDIRRTIFDMLKPHESHHIGCSLSIVDILAVLYFDSMNVFPKKPNSPMRDIFILSKGHAAAALYATLSLAGFFPKKLLTTFEEDEGALPGHATNTVPGVEVSTGSLGHGLSIGAGFALSFLHDKKPNNVYVLLSDGELNEGSTWEAIMFAGHHKLHNLVAIVDANGMQGYGKTKDIIDLTSLVAKAQEFRWDACEIDGHDIASLQSVLAKKKRKKPLFVVANTIKGKGIGALEGKFESHYKSLSKEQITEIVRNLNTI